MLVLCILKISYLKLSYLKPAGLKLSYLENKLFGLKFMVGGLPPKKAPRDSIVLCTSPLHHLIRAPI